MTTAVPEKSILQRYFASSGYEVRLFSWGGDGVFTGVTPDIVLTDSELLDADMYALLRTWGAAIVVLGDRLDVDAVLELRRHGVKDVLPLQLDSEGLAHHLLDIYQRQRATACLYPHAVGQTLRKITQDLRAALASGVTAIHLCGETGTGKEVVAQALASMLSPQGLISVNCGSIQPALLASELFGHCRGAFTDAKTDKLGIIECADNGWLFLDEIASLNQEMQASLLRVLEDGGYRRVGEAKKRVVNIRVLSATNVPIQQLVVRKQFRADLWQRLRELEINLPPLRERGREEIAELVEHFMAQMRAKGTPYLLADSARSVLLDYDWCKGNARELRNCLRSMTIQQVRGMLTIRSFPQWFWEELYGRCKQAYVTCKNIVHGQFSIPFERLTYMLLLHCIEESFHRYGKQSVRQLADRLGLSPSTLSRKLRVLIDHNLISAKRLALYVRIKI